MDTLSLLNQPGYELIPAFELNLLIVAVPKPKDALRVVRHCTDKLASAAANFGFKAAVVRHQDCQPGEYAFCISARMSRNHNMSNEQSPQNFVWFGGVVDDVTDHQIQRMKDADEPMGLVLPTIENGILKTIQLGINKASVELFGFNAKSMEDMRSAIQRDTTSDWYASDLDVKRQLFQQGGSSFEQVARINSRDGWFLMRFNWERIDGSDLVIGRGKRESDRVERPELLQAA